MNRQHIRLQPLNAANFAPFGAVISSEGNDFININQGRTRRYHALSVVQASGEQAAVALSIFHQRHATTLPCVIDMLERHPLGSQSFIPLQQQKFLIVVALPVAQEVLSSQHLHAFISNGRQGIHYRQGGWHHPLLSLSDHSDFLVVDRIGAGENCEQCQLAQAGLILSLDL
ncbi:ureidoglycolate hydrolase [Acinetobacter larvae]|uniref:Ureidoglycolate hydrolase n=1 Tax=Acinetobacter larvae TaxID=1789224 RepID=A0A1B2M3X9_9GAMM|nr:ureidoglycolate hydrolase [Acinetobacter larvae]